MESMTLGRFRTVARLHAGEAAGMKSAAWLRKSKHAQVHDGLIYLHHIYVPSMSSNDRN